MFPNLSLQMDEKWLFALVLLKAQKSTPEVIVKTTEPRVVPNPTSGKISVFLPEQEEKPNTINIIDALGQKIYSKYNVNENVLSIDLNNYSDGIYSIVFLFKDRIDTKTIVKRIN